MIVTWAASVRAMLANALCLVYACFVGYFAYHAYKYRARALYTMAAGVAGLCLSAMLLPNAETDWVSTASLILDGAALACWWILQYLTRIWMGSLQKRVGRDHLYLGMVARYRYSSHLWCGVTALLIIMQFHRILISVLLCVQFLSLVPWAGGLYQAQCEVVDLANLVSTGSSSRSRPHSTDPLLLMELDAHLVSHGTARHTLVHTAGGLVLANLGFCAAAACNITFSLMCYRFSKLCDLDLIYIGFFWSSCFGFLPFLILLAMPRYLPHPSHKLPA